MTMTILPVPIMNYSGDVRTVAPWRISRRRDREDNVNGRPCLERGNVAAVLRARAKASTQQEWEADVAQIWDQVVAELQTNPGYRGALALWNSDEPGTVLVIGLWESMAHRLAYEARSA